MRSEEYPETWRSGCGHLSRADAVAAAQSLLDTVASTRLFPEQTD
jgi:hypothetical protein